MKILPTRSVPAMLLLDRETFWKTLRRGDISWAGVASMAGFVVASCAVYGAVMAGWRSPTLALYAAVKLPFVFVASTALVAVFNWMIAAAMRSGLAFRQTVALTFASMVVAGWIMLALTPVALFFVFTGMPKIGVATAGELDFAYRLILFIHVAVLAVAGVAGNGVLYNGLRTTAPVECPVKALFAAWLAMFAIVGCQMSWMLSPFVGHPDFEVTFFNSLALKTNFIEVVFGRLVPSFITGKSIW
ncbi:MAG: hypothetical protein FWG05_02375 [Kiritimatiellaeota bacterium]|nr:hypothetical protein [Kiritimatiellota bacterium]